jgi:hypothetical protein
VKPPNVVDGEVNRSELLLLQLRDRGLNLLAADAKLLDIGPIVFSGQVA